MNDIIKLVNVDGTEVEANVIMSFKNEENGNDYVVYKKNGDDGDMETIYASKLVTEEDGNYSLVDISDEEWDLVKKIMGTAVNSKED